MLVEPGANGCGTRRLRARGERPQKAVTRRPARTPTARQQPIDVEHAEADAFDVKGADRARQGFALIDDWLEDVVAWIGAQHRDQGLDVRFRARTVIGGHLELQTIRPTTRSSILPL